jgi:hypothetical protein
MYNKNFTMKAKRLVTVLEKTLCPEQSIQQNPKTDDSPSETWVKTEQATLRGEKELSAQLVGGPWHKSRGGKPALSI